MGDEKSEDTDLWVKIGIKFPFAWDREYLSIYHQNATNRIHEVNKFKKEPAFCRTVSEALRSGIVPADKVKDLREYAAYVQLIVVRHLIRAGQKSLARKILSEAEGTTWYRK